MPVEEIAGIIDKCLDESSNKKNSVFSRETISRDQIMKSAEDLARIINGSLETEEGQKTMSYDDLARFLMASCSADNVIFLDDDEQQDPLQEDDLDIWRGLPQQKLSTSQVPAVAQVCSAISELSSTLGDLETTFTKVNSRHSEFLLPEMVENGAVYHRASRGFQPRQHFEGRFVGYDPGALWHSRKCLDR
jgi:hypothetical protein